MDVGIAFLEPGATRQHAYVALTREREENHAVVPDPTGTLDPREHLAGILSQTLDRESALATVSRLREAAGIPVPDHRLERDGLELELGR